MMLSVLFVSTAFLMNSATSTAFVVGVQTGYFTLNPTRSSLLSLSRTKRASVRRRMNINANRNREDSSITSTTPVPGPSSMFGRSIVSDDATGDMTKLAKSSQRIKVTEKFSNNDINIENFPSSDVESNSALSRSIITALTVAIGFFFFSLQGDFVHRSTILDIGISSEGPLKELFVNPVAALERVVEMTDSMGTLGIVYFGVAYCIAEILAVPAIPLTASAGYLFGPIKGTVIVLLSASIAAGVSFQIGRTLLRDFVEDRLKDYPKFAKIDKAIGREGFKLMLLLRLSPIFPFALSNYLYGASSINFPAFMSGTLLGFAPGTLAYVYTGYVGKALTVDGGSNVYPWYVYLGGLTVFSGLLKVVADIATRIVEEIEDEET